MKEEVNNIEQIVVSDSENLKKAVVLPLIYFDIFHYPLTLDEIIAFSPLAVHDRVELQSAIYELAEENSVFQFGDFYSLKNDPGTAERRKKGNALAEKIFPKALRRAKFIQKFPFVESVNLSGSLSKNYFDETTDFDFFIIAKPGRVWICRTLLTLYKKIFLLNSRKYFCINYFIGSDQLQIPDRNLFSATEIVTLKNQTGTSYFDRFLRQNAWVRDYFPNFTALSSGTILPEKKRLLKKISEAFFYGAFGNKLDGFCFRMTLKFRRKKFSHLTSDEFEINMRTKKNASKHHPQGFQFRVLKIYEEKCVEFSLKHPVVQ